MSPGAWTDDDPRFGHWRPSSAQLRCRAEVAAAFGVRPWHLAGPDRTDRMCRARFAAAWVIRTRWPGMSTPQLGRIVGHLDHSTAINALRRAEQLRATDMHFHYLTSLLAAGASPPAEPAPPVPAPARRGKDDPAIEAEWAELLRPERRLTASAFDPPPVLRPDELARRRGEGERRHAEHAAYWLAREKPGLGVRA